MFPVLVVASFFSVSGDWLFSILSLIFTSLGIISVQIFANLYNDYFDVKHGTDGANNEYFNAGMNSRILEGAQISGGSRAIELGLISLKGTKKLANYFLLTSLIILSGLLLNNYFSTSSIINIICTLIISLIGFFLGYFYTAKPLRLSARKGLGEFVIFLTFVPLLCLGSAFAMTNTPFDLTYDNLKFFMIIGVPLGLLTTNILLINHKTIWLIKKITEDLINDWINYALSLIHI